MKVIIIEIKIFLRRRSILTACTSRKDVVGVLCSDRQRPNLLVFPAVFLLLQKRWRHSFDIPVRRLPSCVHSSKTDHIPGNGILQNTFCPEI